MGLFNKNDNKLLLFDESESTEIEVDYNMVVEWLTGLSDDDYRKVCEVTQKYRETDVAASKILGTEFAPRTFIVPPEPATIPAQELNDLSPEQEKELDTVIDQSGFIETPKKNRNKK